MSLIEYTIKMSRNIITILCLSSSYWNECHCGVNWIAGVIERLDSIISFTFINMAGVLAEFANLT